MKQRRFKLLTKVVFFYLVVTLVSFIIGAIILQKEANKHMNNILENRFSHREQFIKKILRKHPEKISRIHHTTVEQVKSIPAGFKTVYKDTFMMNKQTLRKEVFRKKIAYLTVEGKHYRVEMSKEADELYKFKDDTFNIIFPILGILVIVIVIANFLLSGYLFEPFRQILKQMSSYKISREQPAGQISTSTTEFRRLKDLFDKMRGRIENDYYQLKEYTENMSHELQTPLSIIQNKTESLLSENNLDQHQAKKIKMIYDEIQHLSKLSSALNLITKIENNEFQNIQTVKTAPVLQGHIDKIEEIAVMKELNIESSFDKDHTFSIDPGLLDILVRNLLKNALRYSFKKTMIHIKTENSMLIISNQGEKPDFSNDEIFARFKKGNGTHSVGLGLAIVKKICHVSQLEIDYFYHEHIHRFEIYPKLG